MPGIFSPDLFRHGSVLHVTVAHLFSVLNAGKGMGGKGMKTSEIPLPPIPLQVSAAAPPHVHHARHLFLFSGSVQARQRFASRGGSCDFCFECRQRNGWQGNKNLRNSFATHSLANLCPCTSSCASCLASFLRLLGHRMSGHDEGRVQDDECAEQREHGGSG